MKQRNFNLPDPPDTPDEGDTKPPGGNPPPNIPPRK